MDLLLVLPPELLSLTLSFVDTVTIFSLSVTARKYSLNKIMQSILFRRFRLICCNEYQDTRVFMYMTKLHLDAITNGYLDLFKWFVSDTNVHSDIKMLYIKTAIESDQLEIIKYFDQIGYPKCIIFQVMN